MVCVTALLMVGQSGDTKFVTQPGERREITLTDGSVVDLAPKSALLVQYRERERTITLNDGEALFRVAKNPIRPFIVRAAMTRVRAVGTVFNVERGTRGVSVTVVEGRVAVSQQSAGRSTQPDREPTLPMLSLGANQQVSIAPDGGASAVRNIAGDVIVGWAADQLVFDSVTIAEVARRFNLRNQTKIEIRDSRLAARHVSGVFQASDLQSFIAFIEAAGDVQVSRPDSAHIVVSTVGSHVQ
jgi:transmembrane sensor